MAILITGASVGFGAAMCRAFVNAGFDVHKLTTSPTQ